MTATPLFSLNEGERIEASLPAGELIRFVLAGLVEVQAELCVDAKTEVVVHLHYLKQRHQLQEVTTNKRMTVLHRPGPDLRWLQEAVLLSIFRDVLGVQQDGPSVHQNLVCFVHRDQDVVGVLTAVTGSPAQDTGQIVTWKTGQTSLPVRVIARLCGTDRNKDGHRVSHLHQSKFK